MPSRKLIRHLFAVLTLINGGLACAATPAIIPGAQPATATLAPGIQANKPAGVTAGALAGKVPMAKPTMAKPGVKPNVAPLAAPANFPRQSAAPTLLPPPPPLPVWSVDVQGAKERSALARATSLVDQRLQLAKKRKELEEVLRASRPMNDLYVESIGSFSGKRQADLMTSDGRLIPVNVGDVISGGYRVSAITKTEVVLRSGRRKMILNTNHPVAPAAQSSVPTGPGLPQPVSMGR